MRMKHGSDRGATISVKPRLLAAFTAVAMMFATAVPALLPRTAVAVDGYDANITARGGICSPLDIELGDTNVAAKVDTGVATWVGRDMYVGSRPSSTSELTGWDKEPGGTYAAEAEGLTLVNGRLAMNPYKKSWKNNGFRFGVVGFGAQFRPAPGTYTLAVSGQNTAIGAMEMPANMEASSNVDTNVGAWARGAFVGGTVKDDPNWYKAKLAGKKSYTLKGDSEYARRAAVVGFWTETDSNESITWNAPASTLFDDVNGVNYNDYNKTGRNYTENIQDQSAWMYALTPTGTVTTRIVESGEHWRNKYDDGKINYQFKYSSTHKEKVLVFVGDGTSHMQTFNLKASELNSTGYSGISYDFRNFPSDASIGINIVQDDGKTPYTGDITYHNGWQFWWTPTATKDTALTNLLEIGNGYFKDSSDEAKKAYSAASQAIMWNYGKTNLLSIRGGTYNGQSDNGNGSQSIGTGANQLGDDPAAAMLGSILVPHGSFDDHVTTNGRVWVGEDFMMNNPQYIAEFAEGGSASIIDMDQERHNFAWYGSLSTTCSTIDWTKVGEGAESSPLPGTTWAVYNDLDAAKSNSTTPAKNEGTEQAPNFTAGRLFTVTDNVSSSGDLNPIEGAFQLQKLLPNANYYIRETATGSDTYKVNPNIYQFQTTNSGTTTNRIVRVLDANGNPISGENDQLMTSDGSIINPRNGSSIEWGKTKKGEQSGLSGSEWVLTKTDEDPNKQWLITDDGKPIDTLTILDGGQDAGEEKNVTQGRSFTLSAQVLPADANQHVTWSASPSDGVVIAPADQGREVDITVQKMPVGGQILLTATAADGTTQDRITLNVDPIEVASVEVKPATASVMIGDTVQLNAVVKDAAGSQLTLNPDWSSDSTSIATVDSSGTVTGVAEGTVTITATANGKTGTATVTVTKRGTRIYVDASAANWGDLTYLYYWEGGLTGPTFPGKLMEKQSDGLYYLFLPTQQAFKVIVNCGNNGCKTADTTIDASGAKNTFKLTIGSNKSVTIDDNYSPKMSTKAKARRMIQREAKPAWTHIDTTGWGSDKKLEDQNPAAGQFKVDGLLDGTYTLQENKAPEGYFINPTIYTVKIENGTVTWSPEPGKDSNGLQWISDVPTEFNWSKVDAGYSADDPKRNPIAGSKWRLEKFMAPATAGAEGTYETNIAEIKDCTSDDQSGCAIDKDSEAGKFKLTGLALGKYRLVETEAPTGYTKLDTYYYFELSTMNPENPLPVKWTAGTETSWDKQTGSYNGTTPKSEKAVEVNAAPNYRSPGDVYWGKVSSETDTDGHHVYLGGSEWSVTYTPPKGDTGNPVTVKIADRTTGPAECTPTEESYPAWACDAYPTEGRIGFRNLPWGTYTMKETKAPDGYYADPDAEYTFTVDANNRENVQIYVKNSDGSTGDPIQTPSNPTDENGKPLPDYPNQVISNEPGVILPATGGEGNTLIVLFGFALIAISMLGCGVAIRKRI